MDVEGPLEKFSSFPFNSPTTTQIWQLYNKVGFRRYTGINEFLIKNTNNLAVPLLNTLYFVLFNEIFPSLLMLCEIKLKQQQCLGSWMLQFTNNSVHTQKSSVKYCFCSQTPVSDKQDHTQVPPTNTIAPIFCQSWNNLSS